MKKLFLILGILGSCGYAKAAAPADFNYPPISSYTAASTPGPVLFTSATIKWVGIIVASAAPNSYVSIWRSTSAAFTTDISTLLTINTGYQAPNNPPVFIPFFEIENSSYTYLSKVGDSQVIYLFRCMNRSESTRAKEAGVCPAKFTYFGK